MLFNRTFLKSLDLTQHLAADKLPHSGHRNSLNLTKVIINEKYRKFNH